MRIERPFRHLWRSRGHLDSSPCRCHKIRDTGPARGLPAQWKRGLRRICPAARNRLLACPLRRRGGIGNRERRVGLFDPATFPDVGYDGPRTDGEALLPSSSHSGNGISCHALKVSTAAGGDRRTFPAFSSAICRRIEPNALCRLLI